MVAGATTTIQRVTYSIAGRVTGDPDGNYSHCWWSKLVWLSEFYGWVTAVVGEGRPFG